MNTHPKGGLIAHLVVLVTLLLALLAVAADYMRVRQDASVGMPHTAPVAVSSTR